MTYKTISYGILKALGIILGILILLFFLWEIQSVIIYIGIAAVLSLIGRPAVLFMRHKLKLPNLVAVIIVLVIFLSIFIGLILLFVPIIVEQSQNLSQIDIDAFRTDLNDLNRQINEFLGVNQINIVEGFKQSDFVKNFEITSVPKFLNNVFGSLGSGLIGLFSIIFISFFLLKDSKLLLNSVLAFSNRGDEDRFKRVFHTIKILLSRYFVGLTFQITILFLLYAIILMSFGIDNAIAIAFICAFLNLIPYLGPTIAGVLMMMFVISSNLGSNFSAIILPKLIKVGSLYIACQILDNFIFQPLIFGKSVRSNPLEIFLVILIAGLVFGVLGMVVAVPAYTALKVIAKESLGEYKIVRNLTRNL